MINSISTATKLSFGGFQYSETFAKKSDSCSFTSNNCLVSHFEVLQGTDAYNGLLAGLGYGMGND